MSKGGHFLKKAQKKSDTWKNVVLIVEALILTVMLGVGGFGYYYATSKLNLIQRAEWEQKEFSQDDLDRFMNFAPDAGAVSAEDAENEDTGDMDIDVSDETYSDNSTSAESH